MNTLARTVHLLSLGIWAGTAVFFNGCVALRIFAYFRSLPIAPPPGLPTVPTELATRMAGDLIATIFPIYFGLQLVCGTLAAGTGLWLSLGQGRWAWARALLLLVVCATVWVHVGTLYRQSTVIRDQQYSAYDAGQFEEAEKLRKQFFALHGPSLLLDFTTTALVLVALGMTGFVLPAARASGAR